MKSGPPPKPTKLKVLEGNPGHRPLANDEPRPKLVRTPSPPRSLRRQGKSEWRRLTKELTRLGLLTELDLTAFHAYCTAYQTWREAQESLSKEGMICVTPTGFTRQSPRVRISSDALNEMRRWGQELGLTPAARTRIHVETTRDPDHDWAVEFLYGPQK